MHDYPAKILFLLCFANPCLKEVRLILLVNIGPSRTNQFQQVHAVQKPKKLFSVIL